MPGSPSLSHYSSARSSAPLCGVVTVGAVLRPLCRLRTRPDGGSFAVGDMAIVANGKRRGRGRLSKHKDGTRNFQRKRAERGKFFGQRPLGSLPRRALRGTGAE
jgi:hypothetical protein